MTAAALPHPNDLTNKAGAFTERHRRVVAEFEASLENAAHFLKLAHISMEAEPEETALLLNQIREIGLLGHLTEQFQEFERMAALLNSAAEGGETELDRALADLRQRYEHVVGDAAEQETEITNLLSTLKNPH